MKTLFSAFPLLKTKRFCFLLSAILLLCAFSGFLYTPEETSRLPAFAEEKAAIEEAISVAENRLLDCDENEKARFLQEKAFYTSALKFHLSPWSSEFAYEGLSLYAALSLNGGEERTLGKLETILQDRDAVGLYNLCQENSSLPDLDLRRLTASGIPESAGKNALLYDIDRLEESLSSGKDRYFAKEKVLTETDEALFQNLLEQKEKALRSGRINPVPFNKETLLTAERIFACLLCVLLLAVAGYGPSDPCKKHYSLLLLPLSASVLLCSTVLGIETLFFAPGTAKAEILQWGGALPFFPTLFLRLFSRVLGSLPLMLLCFGLRVYKGKTKAWKYLSLLPPLRLLLSVPLRLTEFPALGDLSLCLFPDLSAHALRPFSPWPGILLWVLALGFVVLLLEKEQKLTNEKQELSLEMR